ncbi:Protein ULTRAPETALA 1 [Zea mays]|uniref:Protein ULTRAPETALA 1 n=2 Tax=Zea mays TaxID=4577 RepID=A0A8J8XR67_MAIZE|nr:Protein ULTRAPETALA 1 [Zea mays]PWZ12279.1 Protein ULTRAPETALA 1 [Zea mays]
MAAANGAAAVGAGAGLFSEEELREVSGVRWGEDFVEVTCGCTSHRYGDAVGRLRVCASGDLEINCECTPGCREDKLTPAAFEKHSGKETAGKWRNSVWVMVEGEKVPLSKTVLLKYYYLARKSGSGGGGGCGRRNGRPSHRDEFVCCTRCGKGRRVSCADEEERASRKVLRGCSRSPSCTGCMKCVCFGCETCRFVDCDCQTCVDFYRNSKE